ncbi:MAG: universal stress protein [Thermoplasmata archaeon]
MYGRVILPTDGSDCAMRGVRKGLEFAEDLDIKAVAIYVINTSEFESLHHESIKASARSGLKEKGKKALEKVKETAEGRNIELETKLFTGKPYKEITNFANEDDIIYISSHGMSGFTNLFMGSTTERVLKHSKATVAVVSGK